MKSIKIWACSAIIALCGVTNVQAQVMKSADLEKYAKQRYGERWLDALQKKRKKTKISR